MHVSENDWTYNGTRSKPSQPLPSAYKLCNPLVPSLGKAELEHTTCCMLHISSHTLNCTSHTQNVLCTRTIRYILCAVHYILHTQHQHDFPAAWVAHGLWGFGLYCMLLWFCLLFGSADVRACGQRDNVPDYSTVLRVMPDLVLCWFCFLDWYCIWEWHKALILRLIHCLGFVFNKLTGIPPA